MLIWKVKTGSINSSYTHFADKSCDTKGLKRRHSLVYFIFVASRDVLFSNGGVTGTIHVIDLLRNCQYSTQKKTYTRVKIPITEDKEDEMYVRRTCKNANKAF